MNIEKINSTVNSQTNLKKPKDNLELATPAKNDSCVFHFKEEPQIDIEALKVLFLRDSGGISPEEFLKELEKYQ